MAQDQAPSFRNRAFEHYQRARENVREVAAGLQAKDASETENYREPLSCDERREITLLLSWGGPSDGFKVSFDMQGNVLDGYYFFADWFEYEEFKLSDEELDSVLTVYPISPLL